MNARSGARIGTVVLAAGCSARMGEPKQLLHLSGRTALEHTLENVRAARVDEVVLVLGFAVDEIWRRLAPSLLDGVSVVINRHYEQGMASSLRAGLSALSGNADAAFIVLADQPFVRAATMDRIIEQYRASTAEIMIPFHDGRRGNPVLLDRKMFSEAMALEGDMGCRSIFASHAEDILEVEVDDPGVLQDLDTREDYERIIRESAPLRIDE